MGHRRRVLVLEDEPLVAMMVEAMLSDLGHEVVGPALRVATALPLAREAELDLAVLDINVAGERSFPVARLLRERGIPFIFATGYGASGVSDEFAGTVTLDKPFDMVGLKRALDALIPAASAGTAAR